MIELDAKQVPDDIVNEAIALAQTKIDEMCDFQTDYLTKVEVQPQEVMFNKPSQALLEVVRGLFVPEIKNDMIGNTKVSFNTKFSEFQQHVMTELDPLMKSDDNDDYTHSKVKMAVFQVVKDVIRDRTLHEDLRVDNRSMTDIRPLYTQVDTVPRAHGTGLFRR